jgi:hypothetical protein
MRTVTLLTLAAFICNTAIAEETAIKIPSGAKIFVAPMDGFGAYVVAAIQKKKVPVAVVTDREKAEYEITGTAESQKAGWAKILLTSQTGSAEQASLTITNIKTSEVVWAYNVNKGNSARGKQSTAEACAKHLKEVVGQ